MNILSSCRSIIFDLDGTLIDSAPSILASFENALKLAGIPPRVPLTESLIGPPLRQTLINLTGNRDDAVLDNLVQLFKESYDSEGYRSTRIYDGIEQLLATIADRQMPMGIATNKRKIPTLKILGHLGWESYFSVVGTLDSVSPPYAGKGALISAVLGEMAVEASTTTYIGDKREDGEAAQANRMPFVAVGWGYGEWGDVSLPKDWSVVDSPLQLLEA